MKYKDNIEAVASLQPDYLGFIFYDKSSRFFDGEIPNIPNTLKKVGVFVNASPSEIIALANTHSLDVLQLHGNQSKEFVLQLNGLLRIYGSKDFEIWKVFSVGDNFDFNQIKPFEKMVSKFLFDTKGQLKGGNGYTFNWELLNDYTSTKPYILSGGIGINEIENIVAFKKSNASNYCYALDVNSKFEIEPGLKDTFELEKFKNATCNSN